jgi:hypothetical protein
MTTAALTRQFQTAHAALASALSAHHQAARLVAAAQLQLERQRAYHIRAGVPGKNEAERGANLEAILRDSHDELFEAERELADARLELELARLEHDQARYALRLLELEGRFYPDAA